MAEQIAELDELRRYKFPNEFHAKISFEEWKNSKSEEGVLLVNVYYTLESPPEFWHLYVPITDICLTHCLSARASALELLGAKGKHSELITKLQDDLIHRVLYDSNGWHMPEKGPEKLNLCFAQTLKRTHNITGMFPFSLRTEHYEQICKAKVLYTEGRAEEWIAGVEKAAEAKGLKNDAYTGTISQRIIFEEKPK